MNELIRDPLWTFVSVICALLAVIVAIVIFFAQRKTKKLSYELASNTQLLGVKDEIQGKVKILYEGEEVKNVHLLTVRLYNTGNQSISSKDYERALTILVNQEAKILTYEVIDEEPNNLGATVVLDGNKLILSPVLMNPRDSFSIKALISDFEGKPIVDGRINGIKTISRYSENQVSFFVFTLLSLVLIAFGAPNMDKNGSISLMSVEISKSALGATLFLSGYFLMMVGMLKNKKMMNILEEIARVVLRNRK
jgi:hypothetical protein